jgi:hypothetical protein
MKNLKYQGNHKKEGKWMPFCIDDFMSASKKYTA